MSARVTRPRRKAAKKEIELESELADLGALPSFMALVEAAKSGKNLEAAKLLDEAIAGARLALAVCRPTWSEFKAMSEVDRGALLAAVGAFR